jgi:hypothetical protein
VPPNEPSMSEPVVFSDQVMKGAFELDEARCARVVEVCSDYMKVLIEFLYD